MDLPGLSLDANRPVEVLEDNGAEVLIEVGDRDIWATARAFRGGTKCGLWTLNPPMSERSQINGYGETRKSWTHHREHPEPG